MLVIVATVCVAIISVAIVCVLQLFLGAGSNWMMFLFKFSAIEYHASKGKSTLNIMYGALERFFNRFCAHNRDMHACG